MDKFTRAKLILIELESLNTEGLPTRNMLALLNEVIKDAKILAEQVAQEAKSDVIQALREVA